MPNYTLFRRYITITVETNDLGKVEYTGLDADFDIVKTRSKQSNTCNLQIFNLSEQNRKALQTYKDLKVEVEAGYFGPGGDNLFLNQNANFVIFKGDITNIFSTKQGPDWVTTLQTKDGIKAIQGGNLQKSYTSGTPTKQAVRDLLGNLQVDAKKTLNKLSAGQISKLENKILNSYSVEGRSYDELQAILEENGLEGYILDDEMVIQEPNQYQGPNDIVVDVNSGLVGSPELTTEGYVRFTSLIRPDIQPGFRVRVISTQVDSVFKIDRIRYSGSTFGNDWYAEVQAAPIKGESS